MRLNIQEQKRGEHPVKHMSDKEIQLWSRGVILLILVMTAIAMMGEVYRQNWDSKVTAYPTKTEEAIDQYARKILSEMTLEEKVAQMFFATQTSDSELAVELGLGGLLLSEHNLENLKISDISAVVSSFQTGSEVPMLIGANEEGGVYNTVSQYEQLRPVPFLSPAELMTTGGIALVESDTEDKCAFLRSLGINVNFAPVCDVTTNEDAYMHGRALGGDADDTARYAEAVVKVMNEDDVIGVLKHFPGYGNLSDLAETDPRSFEDFETADFLPFQRSIKAGAKMVMMGRSTVPAMDPDAPACLSREVHHTLRRSFGFDGVIISDDLSAQGMEAYGDPSELAVAAVKAGSDMLLTPDFENQISAVVEAVMNGDIARERIDESVLRILKLKIEFGILT